jgi:hypothetical protein
MSFQKDYILVSITSITEEVKMSDKIVRTWKAAPKDMALLSALEECNVLESESARVRAGLRLLAKRNKVEAK